MKKTYVLVFLSLILNGCVDKDTIKEAKCEYISIENSRHYVRKCKIDNDICYIYYGGGISCKFNGDKNE